MQDLANKMANLQDVMVSILNNQEQLLQQTKEHRGDERHESRSMLTEEIRIVTDEHTNQVHHHHDSPYPVILQGSVHSQEEIHTMEDEEDEGTAEYILDYDEYPPTTHEEGEILENMTKRRNSLTPKNTPKVKKPKTEIVPIQNVPDEAKQASDDLIHIVETSQNIQSNVDVEEIIDPSSLQSSGNETLDIKIQPNTKYEFIGVTDDLEFEFPITTLEQLKSFNSILTNNERMIEALKHKLTEISTANEYNFQKALQKVVADNVMHQLNWQGLKGKYRMKDMQLFGNIIYQTWFQHIDFEQYEELLKMITKKAHKRYAKNMERARHRSQGGPNRLVRVKSVVN